MHGLLFVCVIDQTLLLYHEVPYLGQVWLHVRTAGHWTKQLYDYCSALDPIQEKPGKDLKTRMRQSQARGKYGWGENPNYGCTVYRVIQVQLMFHGNPLARFYPSFVKYLHLSYICHKIQSFYGPRADIVVSG